MDDVAFGIMGVPERDEHIGRLAGQIDGPVIVERDTEHEGSWPTKREALQRLIEHHREVDWVCLLQDDVRLVSPPQWTARVRALAAALPAPRVVCLYAADSKRRSEAIGDLDGHWLQIRFSTWGQAILMPRDWIGAFLRWHERVVPETYPEHDERATCSDTRLTWWLQENRLSAWVPVPNLAEHDDMPSTLGHPGHQSVCFNPDWDGFIDWSEGIGKDEAPVVRGSPIHSRYEYTDLEESHG